MVQGFYYREDGISLANSFSIRGREALLRASLQGTPITLRLGLALGSVTLDDHLDNVVGPDIGVNGYYPSNLDPSAVNWPVVSTLGSMAYAESKVCTFEADGGPFTTKYDRLFLYSEANGHILSVSVPMPTPAQITPDTPLAERQFKYRIYMP